MTSLFQLHFGVRISHHVNIRRARNALTYVAGILALAVNASVAIAGSSTYSKVVDFGVSSSNDAPTSELVQGSDGMFYGVTSGTVFRVTGVVGGQITTLHTFAKSSEGANPKSGLVLGSDGNLYGTTSTGGSGGQGSVYKITASGALTVLHAFIGGTDGASPYGGLAQGNDGNFYGTTFGDGSSTRGTVFRISPGGTIATLYSFTGGADGQNPLARLLKGNDGNFYGTTSFGGSNNFGTVFKITPAGLFSTLYSFSGGADGDTPKTALVQGSDGNFYGTTSGGGVSNVVGAPDSGRGTVFKITPAGVHTTLLALNEAAGASSTGETPSGLIQGTDGRFYFTANGGPTGKGVIASVNTFGGLNIVYKFTGSPDGSLPAFAGGGAVGLTQASNGIFYGTTYAGGSNGSGTIFALSLTNNAAAPTFSPNGGTFSSAQYVTISDSTPGSTIYFTTDGTIPTVSSSQYTGQFYLDSSHTVQAMATAGGFANSFVSSATYTINSTPPTVSISASPSTISGTQSSTLTWSSMGATSCTGSGDWSGSIPTSGSRSVTPGGTGRTTFNYTLTCTGPTGSASGSAVLTVTPAASVPTISISLSQPSVTPNQSSILSWSATNATSCTASNAWTGNVSSSSYEYVSQSVPGSYTYTLTCTGSGGTSSNSAVLTVANSAALPTVSISVSPASITPSGSATLSWTSTNATSCSASNAWSGNVATSGSHLVSPGGTPASYTYTLTCTGPSGTASNSATLAVTNNTAAPAVSIAINPSSVTKGQNATLTWSSTNATTCSATNAWSGNVSVSGSQTISPSSAGTYTYSLTCSGTGGTASNSATLTVTNSTPAPTVSISVSPSTHSEGYFSTLSWSSVNATSCTTSGAWLGENVSTSGSISLDPPAGTYTYTLTCSGPSGSATNSTVLTVSPVQAPNPIPAITIFFDQATVEVGQSATLTWSSSNATTCTAVDAWSGAEPLSGSTVVTPLAAGVYQYSLTCSGPGATVGNSATLTVNASTLAPQVAISISPSNIVVGQSATLNWSSANATSCTTSGTWLGTNVSTSGTLNINPTAAGTYSYNLSCSGPNGSASNAVTLTVSDPGKSGSGGGALGGEEILGLCLFAVLRRRILRGV